MKLGAMMFSTDYSIRPDDLARLLEDRGFESLWVPEHTHIPASRQSPWPGGEDLPRDYWHTYDPFMALTAAAGRYHQPQVGNRHLFDDRTRPDHHRQGGRQPGHALQRPVHFRHRRRVERRRDGQPRHEFPASVAGPPGEHSGHESPLDPG